ncbi:Uncharacterised protein [Mycobacteroides abscessus subsp. abscessus]|uniref:hypothetical protein n=1 Tax=Mycobacteroides abscessus TaxID=36809 RepID=UPI000926A835|nr:hypothetical protein [Mycobacteroides abscessus]SHS17781.1 Uncharacterised protein [Mycobacteroides abscessus subsp. abscessus]
MTLAPGTPWPDAVHGEVVSPSGQRAYLAPHAAELAHRSPRWATDLARRDNEVRAEQGQVAGRQGGKAWFLLADDFEHYLGAQNSWPPAAPARHHTEWQHLLQLQGADLEAERRTTAELRAQNAALTEVLAQRNEQIAQLARMVADMATPPPGTSRPPAASS